MRRVMALLVVLICGAGLVAGQRLFPLQTVLDVSSADTDGPMLVTQLRPSFTAFVQARQEDLDAPTVLFDSNVQGVQSWMDQQLDMLDSLQSLFAPVRPCGHARTDLVLEPAQMASSRFGPALLTLLLQQMELSEGDDEDDEDEGGPQDLSGSLDWEPLFASQVEEEPQDQDNTLFSSDLSVAEQLARDPMATFWAEDEPKRMLESKHAPKKGLPEPPLLPAGGPPPARPCDVVVFAVLAVLCVLVWGSLLRNCLTCSHAVKQERTRAAGTTANPLLAPLMREESLAPEVVYASHEVPEGTYYVPSGLKAPQASQSGVPQGDNWVRINYRPLHSEQ